MLRLAELTKQRQAIDLEIARIESNQGVESFSGTQIRERFALVNREARRLVSDFREVEENFKELTARIQASELDENQTQGSLVGQVLDADTTLKDSDQGKSFYAFWSFLLSPSRQEKLQQLIAKVYELPEITQLQPEPDPFVRRIKSHLLDTGDKVLRSNHRLAAQLRRALAESHALENRRVGELIAGIKRAVFDHHFELSLRSQLIELDIQVDVGLIADRPWWRKEEAEILQTIVGESDSGVADFQKLFNQFSIHESDLRRKIAHCLEDREQVSLREVIEIYPLEKGLAELVGYLQLASRSARHVMDGDVTHSFICRYDDSSIPGERLPRTIVTPNVLFIR